MTSHLCTQEGKINEVNTNVLRLNEKMERMTELLTNQKHILDTMKDHELRIRENTQSINSLDKKVEARSDIFSIIKHVVTALVSGGVVGAVLKFTSV